MGKVARLYRKLHKWPGFILSFILLYYGITGIFMNHREFFSGVDISRKNLPEEFRYLHWNNGALKGNLIVDEDSILVYGNIGIWVTDSTFRDYRDLNAGFPNGVDNRKIFDLHRSADGNLYAATQFGLYAFDSSRNLWQKFPLEVDITKFVAVESVGDTLYALSRSYLFRGVSEGIHTHLQNIELPAPADFINEVTLFETIWQVHSGEIFGIPGKLFVDAMGLVTIFLSLTGIIYFLLPGWIRRLRRKNRPADTVIRINKWSLKWHNYTGAWLFLFLLILFFTGMFLRPPLLIAIANAKVAPLRYSHLNQPNPWYDKLRDLLYDKENEVMLLSSSQGMYAMETGEMNLEPYDIQPPVSVMGITALESFAGGRYLVGSFSGLFLWDPSNPEIYNYAGGRVFSGSVTGRPVGDYAITGTLTDVDGNRYMVDYQKGVLPLYHDQPFPGMPSNVLAESGMSLWSLSLELHTGRLFGSLLGDFYILIVPLTGLTGMIVVLSGYLLWRKKYRKKSHS